MKGRATMNSQPKDRLSHLMLFSSSLEKCLSFKHRPPLEELLDLISRKLADSNLQKQCDDLLVRRTQVRAIDFQKDFRDGRRDTLIPIHEGVSLRQVVSISRSARGQTGALIVFPQLG